jgi:hypothetical protein
MEVTMRKKIHAATLAGVAALSFTGVALAGPASAQPVVTGGLINVTAIDVIDIQDVVVQVPVGVAANVCNVSVAAVLAAAANDDAACDANNNQLPVAFRL